MQQLGTDFDVIQTAHDWLQHGHAVALVTVLKTWGSSPRPAGSLLAMRKDGQLHGSVSGGCVEQDLLQRYCHDELSDAYPTCVNYGVNREEATRFGLPCGGRLELLVEHLQAADALQALLAALQQQQLTTRHIDLQTGEVSLQAARDEQEFAYTPAYVRKVYGPQWNMLLIGAGHLSSYVSSMALMLAYKVIVCDPREEYARDWQVQGTQLTTLMPDDAVQEYASTPRSIVLALTHDPKLDDMALLDALQSEAFYIGAIGSLRNCAARRQRLQQLGISATQLARLHAPVGMSIGSHTPAEIAVSILADITRERNVASVATQHTVSLV
jgi:xanthine dehydrogenase accessory factor